MTTPARRCPDELTSHRREPGTSELERRAIAAHLNQCGDCRAALALATMFEATADARPGDDALVARLAEGAARRRRPVARWSPARALAVAAALVLAAGATATAAWMASRHNRSESSPAGAAAGGARIGGTAPATSPRGAAPLPREIVPAAPSPPVTTPPVAVPASSPSSLGSRRPNRGPRTIPPSMSPAETEPTPEALFADANAVRRAGHLRQAVELYRSLELRFPRSAEARSSTVLRGNLLLGLGDFEPAVASFDAYLVQPAGEMRQEALFGRGRALARLGRDAEERATWTELLRHFPGSAYRSFAAKRLETLGANPPRPPGLP